MGVITTIRGNIYIKPHVSHRMVEDIGNYMSGILDDWSFKNDER